MEGNMNFWKIPTFQHCHQCSHETDNSDIANWRKFKKISIPATIFFCVFHQHICRMPYRGIQYLTVFSSSRPTHYHTNTLNNCIYQSSKRQDNLKLLLRFKMELCKDECCRKFNWNWTINSPAKSWIANVKDFITISNLNPVTHM